MNNGISVADYATDTAIEIQTKTFLKALNSSGGKPMEQMTPAEARKVLEGAQTSVEVDISGVEVSEKSITEDGISVKFTLIDLRYQRFVTCIYVLSWRRLGDW